jgi:hypothetical protein
MKDITSLRNECIGNLDQAIERQRAFCEKVINDMTKGIINSTEQGYDSIQVYPNDLQLRKGAPRLHSNQVKTVIHHFKEQGFSCSFNPKNEYFKLRVKR